MLVKHSGVIKFCYWMTFCTSKISGCKSGSNFVKIAAIFKPFKILVLLYLLKISLKLLNTYVVEMSK